MSDKPQAGFSALGTVLAVDLSTVEDLPNYVAPPAGTYKMLIEKVGEKVVNEKKVVAVDYIFLELKELNAKVPDEDKKELDTIQWGKDKMSESFYFDDPEKVQTTLGALKKKFGPIGQQLWQETNLLKILEKLPNTTILCQVGRRADDKDTTKFYPYTRNIVAAA